VYETRLLCKKYLQISHFRLLFSGIRHRIDFDRGLGNPCVLTRTHGQTSTGANPKTAARQGV
jgi:hypothetical protein